MSGAAEETDSAIELALDAIKPLKARNPAHELLSYEETFYSMNPPPEFVERFGGDHIPEWARGTEFAAAGMYMNYYEALQRAE